MKIKFIGGAGTVTGSKTLVDSNGVRILIDCGQFQGLKPLRELNWEPLPILPSSIDYVLLTHGHFDHVMALPYLMEQKPDLDVYLYEDEAEVLANPDLNLGSMMGMNLSLKANHLVKDGEIIDVLGTKVKCIHVPGHTKGGVCYYFADYGWLISGDTLFQMSIGRTDFPTGNLNDLLTAIREKLFVLPPWTKVLSGHTPPTTIEEESRCNPFLQ